MIDDGAGLQVRQSPSKRAGDVQVVDFTMLVRYPARLVQCAFTPTPSPMTPLAMRPRSGEWLCRFRFHHPTVAPLDRAER